MAHPFRVTIPLLDVLDVLVSAHGEDNDLHGWAIAKETKRSGPTVYGVLERLLQARWIERYWEEANPRANLPGRRLYRLTPNGLVAARQLLAERRAHPSSAKRAANRPGLAFRVLFRSAGLSGEAR